MYNKHHTDVCYHLLVFKHVVGFYAHHYLIYLLYNLLSLQKHSLSPSISPPPHTHTEEKEFGSPKCK